MNFGVKVALGLVGASVLAASAQAQESDSKKTGLWIGAVIGSEKANLGRKKEKPVYGVAAGYDAQLSGARLGVELEATDSTSGGCSRDADNDGDRQCYKVGLDLYAGVRAGVLVLPNLLVYAKGGYVNGAYRVEDEDDVCCHINETEKLRGSGWRAGVGVERDFDKAYLRVEYRYTDYAGSYGKHQAVAGVGLRF